MNQFIVEVVALVGWEDLDPEDADDDGNCAVDGAWLIEAEGLDAALDRFHAQMPIAVPDDFLITARPSSPDDCSMSFRGTH